MKTNSENDKPSVRLSVVVVSIFSRSALINCLDSLLSNPNSDNIEIVVADNRALKSDADLTEKYSNVRFYRLPETAGIPILSAFGIAQSTREIVALIDSSSVVAPNWTAAILRAHRDFPAAVVGGAVEPAGRMKLLDWAAYFCEYGEFMRPLKSGAADVLPGNNISFARSLLAIGSEYAENEFWKTFWCQALGANGVELISEPSILVYYAKTFKLVPFLIRRFHHGRCFAAMRARRLNVFERAFYVAGAIFLPLVFLYRTTKTILNKKRLLKEFLLALPFIIPAFIFWSVGEFCGYSAGAGKSCKYNS